MRTRALRWMAVLGLLAGWAGCGRLQVFDRFTGPAVLQREVAAPPDLVWERLTVRVDRMGLIVESVRPGTRSIQFGWITAPGDGRLYLQCESGSPVGSASLRPRVRVTRIGSGSAVEVSTETRPTGRAYCESTGRFEDWLLERMEPALDAAVAAAAEQQEGRAAPNR